MRTTGCCARGLRSIHVRQRERHQGERDQAKRDAAQAREEAAGLRGRLEALETVMAQGRAADPTSGGRKKT